MYKNIEILNKVTHKKSAIKEVSNFSYANELTTAPITVAEFYEACKNYPIFFAKDANGLWMATVMLGYKENENLFVDKEGNWEKFTYIPAHIRRYPFIFITSPDTQDLTLAIDSEYNSEDLKDESRKLFKEDDTNSEFLDGVLSFLNQFQNDALATNSFIKQLEDWELLEEKSATITTPQGETFNINGFFIVNEEKLKHLSKKKREDICEKNANPLITAHLISLSNIQKIGMK